MVRQWLVNAGCERIFMVNNVTREGIDELIEYLSEDTPTLTPSRPSSNRTWV